MKNHQKPASLWSHRIKLLQIGNHIRPHTGLFTKPTRTVSWNVIHEMLMAKIPNSTDLALYTAKSISSVSYFFNKSVWDHRDIEKARKNVVANAHETRSAKDDIMCLDATTISKTGKTFPDISRVFDTAEKKVTDGYYFFVASIMNSNQSHSYIADWILIAPKAYSFRSMGWMVSTFETDIRLFKGEIDCCGCGVQKSVPSEVHHDKSPLFPHPGNSMHGVPEKHSSGKTQNNQKTKRV